MRSKRAAFLPMAFGVVLLDQLCKLHTTLTLPVGTQTFLIEDVLSLAHDPLAAGAFGFLAGWAPASQLIGFALLSMITVAIVAAFYRGLAPGEFGSAVGLGMILGGIVSHSFDRLRVGSSVDFIHLGSAGFETVPNFNFADVAIILGVVTLIVELLATEMAARVSERPRR